MEKPPSAEKSAPAVKTTKKPYHAPEFSIYGEVREITKSIIGGTGMNDTVHGVDKTSP